MNQTITLPALCREAGISDVTGRRYFADYNPYRGANGWHRFTTPEEKAAALAHIEAKRQRRCRNKNNSVALEGVSIEGATG